MDRIVVKATEQDGHRAPGREMIPWVRAPRPRRSRIARWLKAHVPTPANVRAYRARVARRRIYERLIAKDGRPMSATERERLLAEYEADVRAHGFVYGASETVGVADIGLKPIEEDGSYR